MKGLAACAVLLFATHAAGQEIEPRTYSNAPIGVNFLIAGYAYTRGALQFDSALDLTDAHLKTSNAVVAYARAFDLGGKGGHVRRDRAVHRARRDRGLPGRFRRAAGSTGSPTRHSGFAGISTGRRRWR
jgi:hypothetical protein